jgi:hypothetical protein
VERITSFFNIWIYISVGFPHEGDRSVQPFEVAPKSPAAITTTKMTSRRQWGEQKQLNNRTNRTNGTRVSRQRSAAQRSGEIHFPPLRFRPFAIPASHQLTKQGWRCYTRGEHVIIRDNVQARAEAVSLYAIWVRPTITTAILRSPMCTSAQKVLHSNIIAFVHSNKKRKKVRYFFFFFDCVGVARWKRV